MTAPLIANNGTATLIHHWDMGANAWAPMFKEDNYEAVAASQTDQVLGVTGAAGDLLARVVVNVTTAATSAVSIKDGGGSAIPIVPANTTIGIYSIAVGARSTAGAWKVTTGAGVTVIGIGSFT
jgi:hypothetical protein